jgi:hypothetical protein
MPHTTMIDTKLNSSTLEMDPGDRALIQSYVEKYVNTGVKPSDKDKATMLELVKKYNIKINNNPRPMISRFIKVRQNQIDENGKAIPHLAPRREPSKSAKRKLEARERKVENRAKH